MSGSFLGVGRPCLYSISRCVTFSRFKATSEYGKTGIQVGEAPSWLKDLLRPRLPRPLPHLRLRRMTHRRLRKRTKEREDIKASATVSGGRGGKGLMQTKRRRSSLEAERLLSVRRF